MPEELTVQTSAKKFKWSLGAQILVLSTIEAHDAIYIYKRFEMMGSGVVTKRLLVTLYWHRNFDITGM